MDALRATGPFLASGESRYLLKFISRRLLSAETQGTLGAELGLRPLRQPAFADRDQGDVPRAEPERGYPKQPGGGLVVRPGRTLGNPVKQADALGREALIGYSSSHHWAYPTRLTSPLGHTAQTGCNFNTGLPTSWTDYGEYPGSLRQKSVQWEGQSLTLNFAKHMFRQTVQGVQARTFQHDALGRLVWEEHPEFYHQGVQCGASYLYDDAGRMIQKTDPRGIVTTTAYDDLDRPLSVTYSDSTPAVSYTYDQGIYGIGRLSSVSNSAASTSYTYDRMGRTQQQGKTIDGISFSMSWAYNVGGLPTSYTLPNGTTISQTFDNLGRLTSLTSDWVDASHPATLASNFVYHPTGALTSVEYGNGTTSTRSYTSGGLLKTLQHGTPSDPRGLLDFEYDYQEGISNTGQIMQVTDHNDPSKTQIYSYDGSYRLLTAETQGSHWGLSWGYDRGGAGGGRATIQGGGRGGSAGFPSYLAPAMFDNAVTHAINALEEHFQLEIPAPSVSSWIVLISWESRLPRIIWSL